MSRHTIKGLRVICQHAVEVTYEDGSRRSVYIENPVSVASPQVRISGSRVYSGDTFLFDADKHYDDGGGC